MFRRNKAGFERQAFRRCDFMFNEYYWQREEIMPKGELEELQLKRLKWVVRYTYEKFIQMI